MTIARRVWNVFAAAGGAAIVLACQTVMGTPEGPRAPAGSAALPTAQAESDLPPEPVVRSEAIPGLAGYWQDGMRVFTIKWLGDRYEVTQLTTAGNASPEILDQTWQDNTLTWTYRIIASYDAVTMTAGLVDGDRLTVEWISEGGTGGPAALRRTSSATPLHDAVPHREDFSDPGTGWDIYENENGSVGYGNGYYSVRSIIQDEGMWGYAYRYFKDPVITVDAVPAIAPASNEFGFAVGCNAQPNGDGYDFLIDATGYYYIGKYVNDGDDYETLFSGDDYRASSAIRTGKRSNHIVASCANGRIWLEINGTKVWEGSDNTWSEGDITLGAIGYQDDIVEYHFENLVVTSE